MLILETSLFRSQLHVQVDREGSIFADSFFCRLVVVAMVVLVSERGEVLLGILCAAEKYFDSLPGPEAYALNNLYPICQIKWLGIVFDLADHWIIAVNSHRRKHRA